MSCPERAFIPYTLIHLSTRCKVDMRKVKAYEFPEKVFTEKRNMSMFWTNSVDKIKIHI